VTDAMTLAERPLPASPEARETALSYYCLRWADVSPELLSAWSELQRADAALASPFFRPEFVDAVSSQRDDLELVVWERDGEPVGFLPFERAGRVGKPAGSHVNEFQGAIAKSDVAWSPQRAIEAAGLVAWQFDHVSAAQTSFAPFQHQIAESAYLDLSQGFEHFRGTRDKSSKEHISKTLQKGRKAARELGEVRLESEPANRAALTQLLEWKADQCRRTNLPCMYVHGWVVRLFERFLECQTRDFSGVLLNLYIGDRLAAVQFGFASAGVLHGAVFGYNPELGKYSPGMVLLLRIAQEAETLGLVKFVLGKGDAAYKDGLASGYDHVSEGIVPATGAQASLHHRWYLLKRYLRETRLREGVQLARRWMQAARVRLGRVE
jgi:CelD/BcsL family acetyltransferase involved in cellulose biosynthesis